MPLTLKQLLDRAQIVYLASNGTQTNISSICELKEEEEVCKAIEAKHKELETTVSTASKNLVHLIWLLLQYQQNKISAIQAEENIKLLKKQQVEICNSSVSGWRYKPEFLREYRAFVHLVKAEITYDEKDRNIDSLKKQLLQAHQDQHELQGELRELDEYNKVLENRLNELQKKIQDFTLDESLKVLELLAEDGKLSQQYQAFMNLVQKDEGLNQKLGQYLPVMQLAYEQYANHFQKIFFEEEQKTENKLSVIELNKLLNDVRSVFKGSSQIFLVHNEKYNIVFELCQSLQKRAEEKQSDLAKKIAGKMKLFLIANRSQFEKHAKVISRDASVSLPAQKNNVDKFVVSK